MNYVVVLRVSIARNLVLSLVIRNTYIFLYHLLEQRFSIKIRTKYFLIYLALTSSVSISSIKDPFLLKQCSYMSLLLSICIYNIRFVAYIGLKLAPQKSRGEFSLISRMKTLSYCMMSKCLLHGGF